MYKITFQLNAPICFLERPNFDSMLIYCYMREKYGNLMVDLDMSGDQLSNFPDLPIPYHADGYPLASVMCWDPKKAVEYTGSWKKRWDNRNDDLADFQGKVRKVRINSQEYKSYDIPLNLWSIPEVCFYFESDNPQRVQQLVLQELAGIGKKVSQGFGMYSGFEITESDKDFKKEILRPLRADMKSSQKIVTNAMKTPPVYIANRYCAWRPPYYLPENFAQCFYPGDL